MKKSKEKNFKISKYFLMKKWTLAFYIICVTSSFVFAFLSTLQVADALTFVASGEYDKALTSILMFFAFALSVRAVCFIANNLYCRMERDINYFMRKDISKKMLSFTSGTYSSLPVGAMASRLTEDPLNIFRNINDMIDQTLEVVYLVFVLVYICFLNIFIGGVIVIGLTIVYLLSRLRGKFQKKREQAFRKEKDKNISLVTEVVKSEKDIKGLKLQDEIYNNLDRSTRKFTTKYYKYQSCRLLFWDINSTVCQLMTFSLLIVSLILLQRDLIVVSVFMFVFTNRTTFNSIGYLINFLGEKMTSVKIALKRINQLFDKDKFKTEQFGTIELASCAGNITFENVSFTYKDEDVLKEDEETNKKSKRKKDIAEQEIKQEEEEVKLPAHTLKNLSLEIAANSTVAIVGRSGSGKSTIMNLIARLIDCDEGAVKIDGVDIKQLSQDSLRSNITIVNQFPYIFDTSIKKNLLLAKPDATDEELWKALRDASFADYVEALPDKMETKVGESGVKLSGGQRQRLSIARALLKDSRIILFDESTSSLDNFAQNEIKQSIENLSGQRTVVIVAHRLSTIKNAEKIFFLKEGNISAVGTFDELFSSNEEFREMFLVESV